MDEASAASCTTCPGTAQDHAPFFFFNSFICHRRVVNLRIPQPSRRAGPVVGPGSVFVHVAVMWEEDSGGRSSIESREGDGDPEAGKESHTHPPRTCSLVASDHAYT